MSRVSRVVAALIILIGLGSFASFAQNQPLSKDDIQLLLLGGASTERMVALINQRGIDFQMDPDLAKKFHEVGASDAVVLALQKASAKVSRPPATSSASESVPERSVGTGSGGGSQRTAPESTTAKAAPTGGPTTEERIREILEQLTVNPAEETGEYPQAPTFSLKDFSGRTLDLSDYKGKLVLLNFWATWCGPCRSEIPGFVEIQDRYRDQGLAIIGIAIQDSPKSVQEFFRMYRLNYPVAMGDHKVRQLYGGITGLPTTFLIGRDGRIHYKFLGAVNRASLEQTLRTLLAARSTGPAKASPVTAEIADGRSGSAPAAQAKTVSAAPPANRSSPGDKTILDAGVTKKETIDLRDPGPDQIQQIIREFAAKERVFKEARNNYTYHQVNKVQELDPDGNVEGIYEQDWDILYDDNGHRIERVTYAPVDTLKGLIVTKEDLEAMRSIQPFVLTTDDLPDYDVKYLGHARVDEIAAYVFSVRPKEIKKGRLYFRGVVWVDDRDLQIVKSEGQNVGEISSHKGQLNLFPRFTTYREQIDGKFWFPTYTMADDTLYFPGMPVRVREIIKYNEYKQFKASSTVRIISEVPGQETKGKAQTSAEQAKPKP